MVNEYMYLNAVAQNDWFNSKMLSSIMLGGTLSDWLVESFMDNFGLVTVELQGLNYAFFMKSSRKRCPAFLVVNRDCTAKHDFTAAYSKGRYMTEVIEAGKYGLAGAGFNTELRAEEKG